MTAPHGLRPLLLALLLLLPTAAAASAPAPAPEPDGIRVEPFRVGDRLRYETMPGVGHLLEVLGPSDVVDLHGVLRPARAFRHELMRDNVIVGGEVCHVAGPYPLRREDAWGRTVSGGPGEPGRAGEDAPGASLLYPTDHVVGLAIQSDFPFSCFQTMMGQTTLGGRAFAPGDRLRPADLHPERAPTRDDVSQPALATTFHGRPALEFRFNDTNGGTVAYVLADGLPGIVASIRGRGTIQLSGYQPGSGPAVDVAPSAGFPSGRNRALAFTPHAPTTLDDAALGLAYPFAEAFEALRPDIRAWLRAHPDAVLTYASYDRWQSPDGAEVGSPSSGVRAGDAFETDGGWRLILTDGAASIDATTTRVSGLRAPDGPLANTPVKTTRNHVRDVDDPEKPPALPQVVDGEGLARLAEAHGVRVGTVESLRWRAWVDKDGDPHGRVMISDVATHADGQKGNVAGRMTEIVPENGAVRAVWTTTRTPQEPLLLGILPGRDDGISPALRPAGAEAPLLVQRGEGLAPTAAFGTAAVVAGAAAATALLLVLLALKLVLPLYSRLRRERLLDHPARARLVELARAKPGIRHAELIAALDLSRGTVEHHLDQLVRHGHLVPLRQDGGILAYCVTGALPPDEARRLALLRRGHLAAVHDLYRAEPTLSLREAARRLGIRAPSVHKARRKLEAEGILPRKAP